MTVIVPWMNAALGRAMMLAGVLVGVACAAGTEDQGRGVPTADVQVPDGPDAYWCPMHPDVRSPEAGSCPICAMTLVPIPPPSSGAYELDVAFTPLAPGRGRLTLGVADRSTGTRATSFLTMHERRLHLFIISRTVDAFQHVHPELQADGRFVLDVEVPRPDAYTLVADVYPAGGTPQMLMTTWVTPDYRGSVFPDPSDLAPDSAPKVVGALQVSLESAAPAAGDAGTLTFHLADARTGAPVSDLEPYLGAAGHLVIASADLSAVIHSHPEDATSTGPAVVFDATLPRPGRYKLWAQFQRAGSLVTAPFVIDVR